MCVGVCARQPKERYKRVIGNAFGEILCIGSKMVAIYLCMITGLIHSTKYQPI